MEVGTDYHAMNDLEDDNQPEPQSPPPPPQLIFITKPPDPSATSQPHTSGDFPESYTDIVDEPEELFEAEAKVSGKTSDEWRRRLTSAAADWLGPRGGWVLLVIVIALWLWITYTR